MPQRGHLQKCVRKREPKCWTKLGAPLQLCYLQLTNLTWGQKSQREGYFQRCDRSTGGSSRLIQAHWIRQQRVRQVGRSAFEEGGPTSNPGHRQVRKRPAQPTPESSKREAGEVVLRGIRLLATTPRLLQHRSRQEKHNIVQVLLLLNHRGQIPHHVDGLWVWLESAAHAHRLCASDGAPFHPLQKWVMVVGLG